MRNQQNLCHQPGYCQQQFFPWQNAGRISILNRAVKISLAPGFSPVMTFANHWEAVSTRILHWNGLDFSFCAVGWRVDEHLGRLARWTKK